MYYKLLRLFVSDKIKAALPLLMSLVQPFFITLLLIFLIRNGLGHRSHHHQDDRHQAVLPLRVHSRKALQIIRSFSLFVILIIISNKLVLTFEYLRNLLLTMTNTHLHPIFPMDMLCQMLGAIDRTVLSARTAEREHQ